MKGLLVVAHGSRRSQSNQEVAALAESLAVSSQHYAWVDAAFLELCEPKIPAGIANAQAEGVSELTIYPHFLAAGTHVVNDLPRIVEQAQSEHPDMQLNLVEHLGAMPGLAKFIEDSLQQTS